MKNGGGPKILWQPFRTYRPNLNGNKNRTSRRYRNKYPVHLIGEKHLSDGHSYCVRPSYSFGSGQGFSYGKFETDKTYPPNIQHRIYKSHFRDISRFEKVVGNDCRSQICLLRNQQGPTSIIQTSASHEIATIFRQKLSNRHGQHIILRNIASNRPLPHGRRARGRVHGGLPSLPSQPAPTGYRRGKTRKHHNVSPASRAWISSCRNLPHGSAKLRRYPSSSTSGQKNNPPRSQGKPAETGIPTSVGFASRPCSPPRDSAPATSPRLSSPGERL